MQRIINDETEINFQYIHITNHLPRSAIKNQIYLKKNMFIGCLFLEGKNHYGR